MSAPSAPLQRSSGSRPAKLFKILSFKEVQARPEPKWLVHGVVPRGGLVMLYGPPNVGKTFLALDLAVAVASGQPWVGRETTLGRVLYVVAEGVGGFQKRLTVVESTRRLTREDTERVHFIDEPVQLQAPAEAQRLLDTAREQIAEPVDLVILDTLSRCFVGGDENNAKEVSRLVQSADRIGKETGATVLLVHHTTKAGDSERGSSVLRGSATTMLGVSAKAGLVTLECEKQKDAAPFKPIRLRLVPTSGSCAVELADTSGNTASETVSNRALAALRVLSQTEGLRCSDWLSASGIPDGTFYRHLEELKEADLVTKDGHLYRLTDKGQAALTPK